MAHPTRRQTEEIEELRREVQGLWDSACSMLDAEARAVGDVHFDTYWNADTALLDWYTKTAIPAAESRLNAARIRAGFPAVHWPCELLYETHDRNLERQPLTQ